MRIVFLGPAGVGKGTHAKELALELGFTHVTTGGMLRAIVQAGTDPLAAIVAPIMASGALVPDPLMEPLVTGRLSRADCENFGLDGFPRTEAQAIWLDGMLTTINRPLTHVIALVATRDELLRRLGERAKNAGRADDTPEVHETRLKLYEEQAGPLEEYYESAGRLIRVDAMGSIDEVRARIRKALGC